MADLKLPHGSKPARRLVGLPFAFLRHPFRRPQASPDGRSEPDAGLLEQGWRIVGRDEHGRAIAAPPSRYSDWSRTTR